MLHLQPDTLLNNRYRLQGRIGSGGFSVVWKAIDEKAGGMPVAVKIFMPDKGVDDSLINMFSDEYELTCHLDDNRLVKMTDYFVAEESPCLVMPFMPGGSLYQKLQHENELPEREIARILYQVCGGLNYLHAQEKPVLHLDIKPENILIDYSGNYLLADFGISLKMRSSLLRASNTKGGTFAYSPPELSESRKLSAGSDIFSLGVMLFELCTGALPWSGMGGNAVVIGMPMPELPETYSKRLQEIMYACMERYPQNRPSAHQLEEVARKFLDRGYWEAIPQTGSSEEAPKGPTSAENLQKAIAAGEMEDFVKRYNGEPTAQQRDQFFYDLNKRYGNISRDSFDATLQESLKLNGRKTQPILQSGVLSGAETKPQPQPQPQPSKKKSTPFWIIAAVVLVIGIVVAIAWPKGPSAEQRAEQARLDSIEVADSLALVEAFALMIQDSINLAQQGEGPGVQTKQSEEPSAPTKKYEEEEEVQTSKAKPSIEWVSIPAGTFTMGSPSSEVSREGDEIQHQVTLSAFKMSKYEVTFEQYDAFCNATGRSKPSDEGWGRGKRPVIKVSWDDATAFADWMGCRLPTEAEWEYACRAGTTTPFYIGNCLSTSQANYNGSSPYSDCSEGEYRGKTLPVGSFAANAWGLHDMHGNVWECCSDWYGAYPSGAQTNPKGVSSGSYRVYRGGSWRRPANRCRAAYRIITTLLLDEVGFRLVSPR